MPAQPIRILYVEDEPFLARVVKESLESRNFDVYLVSDGHAVLEAFHTFNPQICVLDVMLPGIDGFSLARQIKNLSPGMPIIFLTARTQTRDLLDGFDAGGNDYLKKPFSMEELIVRIDNLIRMSGQQARIQEVPPTPPSESINLGSFVFYPGHYTLVHPEKERKLSLRETQLLSQLTQDLGKPVLRRNILIELWGDDSFYNSRNLDVYISRMRDYLSADPAIKIITLKGIGYQVQIV